MDWFYTEMVRLHEVLAWASILLFGVRGMAFQLGAKWVEDMHWNLLSLATNILLVISGLSLWNLLHYHPLRDNWLLAKLIAIMVYAVCAHWSMRKGEFSTLIYLGALVMLSYSMLVSMTRLPFVVA